MRNVFRKSDFSKTQESIKTIVEEMCVEEENIGELVQAAQLARSASANVLNTSTVRRESMQEMDPIQMPESIEEHAHRLPPPPPPPTEYVRRFAHCHSCDS